MVSGSVLRLKQEGDVLRCVSSSDGVSSVFVSHYFRFDENLDLILGTFERDDAITRAVQKFYGLRLVRQDRWECLASFVLATNSNIPRIAKMVSAICSTFGEGFEFEGDSYSAFPIPEALAAASTSELKSCGLGYRAPFVKRVAAAVAGGAVDLSSLGSMDYLSAREALLMELRSEKVLLGVGPKVADCVLLYSCDKDEAFPIDVWITRVLARSYPRVLGRELKRKYARDSRIKLSQGDYAKISDRARAYFGRHAGYAQQYLFMAAREEE